jgi:hypothetical protein
MRDHESSIGKPASALLKNMFVSCREFIYNAIAQSKSTKKQFI